MPKKEKDVFTSPLIEIQVTSDNWYRVKLVAATEITFDVQGKDNTQTLIQICRVVPYMISLDCDLMEHYDDGGRTKVNPTQIALVKAFARDFTFKNVVCGLPGFENLHR